MKTYFSIGEMSKLHNTPVKTLRYYDEIGLLKPVKVNEANKYRYYSIEQFEQLHTIHYLKFLGLSLKEIRQHLEVRDVTAFLELLKKQKELTESAIHRLETIRDQFSKRIDEVERFTNMDTIEQPFLISLPARAIVRWQGSIHFEYEWELALQKLVGQIKGRPALFIGKVGLTVARENLSARAFNEYNSVFIFLEEATAALEHVHFLPAGDYACIPYRGNHSSSAPHYTKLLQFISGSGYQIAGDSIERTVINQYITTDNEKYITEIQIPVIKSP